jgi:hypothetical protein
MPCNEAKTGMNAPQLLSITIPTISSCNKDAGHAALDAKGMIMVLNPKPRCSATKNWGRSMNIRGTFKLITVLLGLGSLGIRADLKPHHPS